MFILYFKFISLYLKSKFEYKFGFFIDLFLGILTYATSYLLLLITFKNFNNVAGWTFYEVLLLSNINLTTFSLAALFFLFPMRELERGIQSGDFDTYLVRPLHPLLYLTYRQFAHYFLGDLLFNVFIFYICFNHLDIYWSLTKVIWFFSVILGGTLLQSAVLIATGAVNFWIIRSNSFIEVALNGLRNFLDYPLSIFGKWIQIIFTFVIPFALINYYPVNDFLGKQETVLYDWMLIIGAPLVGFISFIAAYVIWNKGLGRYSSTGS